MNHRRSNLFEFIVASVLLIITPGPGVLSLAGVGSAFGFKSGIRYFFGLFIGHNLVGFLVISGLGALLLGNPFIRTILMVLSSVYLIYLASRIAFSGSKIGFKAYSHIPGLKSGLLLQIINPKAYVVSTTMYSGFLIIENSFILEVLTKCLIANLIWIPVHVLWLYLGVLIKSLELTAKVQKLINYFMAISMISVVFLAMLGTF